jgi:nicotinate dehydrogenase subunit A
MWEAHPVSAGWNRYDEMDVTETYDLIVNGKTMRVAADGTVPLLSVLREQLGLRGTRFGCGTEQCGACMVLVDSVPTHSCTCELATVAGRMLTTVEGLSLDGAMHPVQEAFIEEQAGQCGYCLSGILISAVALLKRNPRPTRAEIAAALDPHLCRCGMHNRVMRAVARAAAMGVASP